MTEVKEKKSRKSKRILTTLKGKFLDKFEFFCENEGYETQTEAMKFFMRTGLRRYEKDGFRLLGEDT